MTTSRPWSLAVPFALCALLLAAAPVSAQGTVFSTDVAVGDGFLLVGTPSEQAPGAIHVFVRRGGEWGLAAEISASDGAADDRFGRALALDGEWLVAGATKTDDDTGAAYFFRRAGPGEWEEVAKVQPADLAPGDNFGRSADLGGDLAAVGTAGQESGRGAVYLFRRDASGSWSQEAKLTAEAPSPNDLFGISVALDGDRVLVGSIGQRENAPAVGAAHLFERDPGTGEWARVATYTDAENLAGAGLGASVALRGDLALLGVPGLGPSGEGGVLVLERDEESGEWSPERTLLPFDGPRPAQFGSWISFDGEEAWIGAPAAGDDFFEGRVYRYAHDAGSGAWTPLSTLSIEALERGDRFGGTFARRGDLAVVGIPGDDFGLGTAAVLERRDGSWTETGRILAEEESYPAVTGGTVACAGGSASAFECERVDLVAFLPVQEMGGSRGVEVNDIWGWTDPETGREYAVVGRVDGTSFVDVTDPENPTYLGNLERTEGSPASTWRDIKVYQNHAFIVADGAQQHGMQVFDLTRLREVGDPPVEFTEDARYDGIASAHNLVLNPESGFAFAVGSNSGGETCGGGLHMIDVRDPKNPTFAGCFAHEGTGNRGTGYTHDGQCVIYEGPDEEYRGREICLGANETALSIADVTDKENPVAVAVASYPNYGYAHQGWLTEDQRYFYMNDELDELQGKTERTRTLVWDVADLDDPILVKEHLGSQPSTDHNLYIVGNRMYQSNYVSGLRVLDISNPEEPIELAWFDTVPYGDNSPGFGGSWSNYPFFESGNIVVTSGSEGLFVLRRAEPELAP